MNKPATEERSNGEAVAPANAPVDAPIKTRTPTRASPSGDNDGFRQYRAPRQHGDVLMEPGLDEVGELVAKNLALLSRQNDATKDSDSLPPLASLRQRAREQMVDDAMRYTSVYRDVEWARERIGANADGGTTIFMAGHQPAIFHPGVWFKNFALSHLAQQHVALPVNLVIDNDVAPGCSVRVPSIDPTSGEVRRVAIAYDTAGGGVPYEQTTIQDRPTFDCFDEGVRKAVSGLVANPCITSLWKHARSAVERCGVAGCALAQTRHGLEGEVGLQTLELPLGELCRGAPFSEFLLMILTALPRFHASYNDETDAYRRAHHIRSSAHPVPHLACHGDWFEAPLWIYGNQSPTRKPAWVKRSGDELILSDSPGKKVAEGNESAHGDRREIRINVSHPKLAAEQLASFVHPDFKLRPRALLTTMYARLVLCDLFLHGIGGGKYDQLGDKIIESFFAITPPQFMVISATVQLPTARKQSDRQERQQEIENLKRQIRDTHYQPEIFADQVSLDQRLMNQKRILLSDVPTDRSQKDWHERITSINRQLAGKLETLRGDLHQRLDQAECQSANAAVLASREHPFCVYELDDLIETYRALL